MSEAFRTLAFALVGVAIGSFLTVVIYRVPRKESVVRPRSACPSCGTQIREIDNIPVLSYLLLRGRCHSCGARISPIYPLTELLVGALFAVAALKFHHVLQAVVVALFMALMVAVAAIDARHRIIPNRLTYPAFVAFVVLILLADLFGGPGISVLRGLEGMAAFGGGLFVLALISPRGMGMGDVKLGAVIGLVLGSLGWRYVAVAAFLAVLAGGVGALVALALGRSRKSTIPFGPYLAAGAVAAALAAPAIASWYTGLGT